MREFLASLGVAVVVISAVSDGGSTHHYAAAGRITTIDREGWLKLASDPFDPDTRYRFDARTACITEAGQTLDPASLDAGARVKVSWVHNASDGGLVLQQIVVLADSK